MDTDRHRTVFDKSGVTVEKDTEPVTIHVRGKPEPIYDLDRLAMDYDLPPAHTLCCRSCYREVGFEWIVCVMEDFSLVQWPFCLRCREIQRGRVEWEDLRDNVERRCADLAVQWFHNYCRWIEREPLPDMLTGIYRDM